MATIIIPLGTRLHLFFPAHVIIAQVSNEAEPSPEREIFPKTVWFFPGQNTQFVGMGKFQAENDVDVRNLYQRANAILGYLLSRISFEDPEGQLDISRFTQPAVFVYNYISVFLAQKLKSGDFSRPPAFVAGHSLGFFNALVAASVLSFEDGLKLVKARAEAMHQAGETNPGRMMVVWTEETNERLQEVLAKFSLDLCVVNTDDQVVIGGQVEAVMDAEKYLKEKGVKARVLKKISVASHTRLMTPAAEMLAPVLDQIEIHDAQIPVMANTTGRPIKSKEEVKEEILAQLTRTVRWKETLKYLDRQRVEKTIEVGQAGVLTDFNKKVLGGAVVTAAAGIVAYLVWQRHQKQP